MVEDGEDGALDQALDDLLLPPVVDRLELELAGQRRQHEREVAHARHHLLFAEADRAPHGVGQHRFVVGDRGADGNAGALIDVGAAPGEAGDLGDDLLHVLRDVHLAVAVVLEVRPLLLHDRDLVLGVARVVGADLGAVAVFERRDDAPAVRVVLRVGGRHDEHVQRQPDAVAADLYVALLHYVQQPHLDALRQVGQFVDAEDAPVVPRDEPVVDRQLVREVAALRHLYRVDLADQVGDRDVRRRQLLTVAPLAVDPLDRRVLPVHLDQVAAAAADGGERVVVDLAAGDDRYLLVEQVHERADQPGLGLPALAQEDDVLTGQDRVLQVREDRVLVADDAREVLLALLDARDQVLAHLLLHAQHPVAGCAQFTDRPGLLVGHG